MSSIIIIIKFIRWCTLRKLRIIGILVKVATVSRNFIRQRLGVQREQNRSQNGPLGYSLDKGAWRRHNAINNNRLTTITEVRSKPPKSSVLDSKGHLLSLKRME